MTWKGTFYTEYAWSLCGSSLLFSRACGRPKATNTPRLFSNLLHFPSLFFHSSLLPPAHFVRKSHLLSHSIRRLVSTPFASFSSPCFSPTIIVLAHTLLSLLAVLVLSAVVVVVLFVQSVACFWGLKARPVCVCVCLCKYSVLMVFIAYEVEHLRQGLRVRVLD